MIRDSKQVQKDKIRERYKGIDQNLLEVIPAAKKDDIFHPQTVMNVAVYARVSTDSLNQTSSYELQKNYYDDMVNRRQDWNLVEIYADEGISGTSLKHRDSFKRMIEDCKSGKIDLIITKSVSRFARNIMDCIGYVRELKALKHPVGVYFETENLYTLKEDSEMALSFTATMAQEESHIKSNIMNASIDMRFSRGIFLTPVLLGYDQDENGQLIINEDEAKTVRLIFFMYLYGYSITEIANTLSSLRCETKRGNIEWSYGSVLQILQNERHCGDIVARKTFTPNYLDHKSRKNVDEKRKVIQRDHHEAIISRDDWLAVQRKLVNQRFGNTSYLPVLHVIKEGFLTGFVPINPRWAGFTKEDYLRASESIGLPENAKTLKSNINHGKNSLLNGYEVVRGQFLGDAGRIYVTFSKNAMQFSTPCIESVNNTRYIEILVNSLKPALVVRVSSRDEKNAIEWSRNNGVKEIGKKINGAAFLPTLYEIFSWNIEDTYRITGIVHKDGNEQIILFDISDAILMIPKEAISEHDHRFDALDVVRNKTVMAFPETWLDSFGVHYTQHESSQSIITRKRKNLSSKGEPFQEMDLDITSEENVKREIDDLIEELRIDGQRSVNEL